MKKLINLIALVMLVSVNVLTPFSYAQVETSELIPGSELETVEEGLGEAGETPEINEETSEVSEEIPEANPEEKGELEQGRVEDVAPENVLPDIQNDVETPSTDETEEEDTESDGVAQPVEETPEKEIQDEEEKIEELERVEESVVMDVIPNTVATLLPGQEFNSVIKTLANGGTYVAYTGVDNNIQSFQRVNIELTGVTTREISEALSEYPVYAWFSGGVLYYSTKAEIIQLNENPQNMFQNFGALTELDLSNFDTSDVTSMGGIFAGCSKLEELNLSGWDFRNCSNASLMMNMTYGSGLSLKKINMQDTKFSGSLASAFAGLNKVEELNLSGADTSNVMGMGGIFNGCTKLGKLNLNGWYFTGNLAGLFAGLSGLSEISLNGVDTKGVTNMNSMFYGCHSLTGLDLSSFDTSNVVDMGRIFDGCINFEKINLSGWNFTNVSAVMLINQKFFYGGMPQHLKMINMTNTKFSGSMDQTFYGMPYVEVKLDGVDTENVTNMYRTFVDCKLTGLDLSSWNTSNVTSMQEMFYGCSNLERLNLSGRDTSKVTSMYEMFYGCSSLTGLDLSSFDTDKVTDVQAMFLGCSKLENLNLNGWDFSNNPRMGYFISSTPSLKLISMSGWKIPENFIHVIGRTWDNNSLEKIEVNNWDLSETKNIQGLFGDLKVKEIKGLDTWNTSGIENMNQMFQNCNNLTGLDLSSWDTSSVTDMGQMFQGCSSLTGLDLSSWDTSKVTNMRGLFDGGKLEEINMSGWDFRNAISNGLMQNFYPSNYYNLRYIKKLNLTNAKFSGSMNSAFYDMEGLEEIKLDGVDTSKVTNMSNMFYDCHSLKDLDLSSFDTSNVTEMEEMFRDCNNLTGLDLSNFDTNKVTKMHFMFFNCDNIVDLNMSGRDFRNDNHLNDNRFYMERLGFYGSEELRELNLTNAKFSGSMNSAFHNLANLYEIKGLDTWDTSKVTDMGYMFQGCSSLTSLDLSSFDTSKVTSMNGMFSSCSNLTSLDLSSFDTSNVTNMGLGVGGLFVGCNKLEEINMSGRNFRNVSNNNLIMGITAGGIPSLTKLNMTNTKYTGNATYAFGGLTKLEELNLDGADTSNVTSMNAMFNGDSNLKNLDLSSFDTSNVKDMNKMFYNTPNLKTIYASEKFVTTALSGDTSSKDMFSGTTSVVGGNGTKFDPNYIDKEYAKIDKVGQTGYFTDKNAITVKFINILDGTETLATFAKGQKLTPPSVNGYHAVGGYLDEAMTQKIDLNKGVDSYSEIYVKYERNGSSGGGGGGGGGATKPDTPKEEQNPAESPQSDASSGTNVKEPESNTGNKAEIQTGSQQPLSPTDSFPDREQTVTPLIGGDGEARGGGTQSYSPEFQQAYKFAHENGITTKDTIQSAQMNGKLTRIAMAKMLSQYAINVLGKTPDTSKTIKFKDVTVKNDADYDDGVTLAYQLGIMGQNMPNNRFRPNDEVSRAEFATALSRLLYQTTDGEYKSTKEYYIPHMAKLYNEGIISNTDPSMAERRGYVMIMLMRSAK